MRRSAGVTVIAILSFVGSTLSFLMGVLVLVTMLIMPLGSTASVAPPPAFLRFSLIMGSLIYIGPAIWGVATGVGLLRLKNWARISTMVFAVLLAISGIGFALSAVALSFIATPSGNMPPGVLTAIRIMMLLLFLGSSAIAVWWLVFFTRPSVKLQFEPAGQWPTPSPCALPQTTVAGGMKRPVSITIIAIFLLVSCAFLPLTLWMHPPAVFFTWLLTGRTATLVYLGVTALNVCIGIGLLRLKPAAWYLANMFWIFGLLNSAVFCFAPGFDVRLRAILSWQAAIFPLPAAGPTLVLPFDITPMVRAGMVGGFLVTAILMYFLVANKRAFYPPEGATR